VDIEATQTVDIISFVELEEVNPIFFHKPYYMEPQKGGDRAYVLLREALKSTGKIGIAKVVIKTRQHLAAVKPQDKGLMLELMHFADEIHDVEDFKLPHATQVGKKELDMAKSLISTMTETWKPEDYADEYREALEKMIEEKVEHPDKAAPKSAEHKKKPSNVIDLVKVLEESLGKSGHGKAKSAAKGGKKKTTPAKKKAKAGKKKAA
jgi:DNA end-binding protein Ku